MITYCLKTDPDRNSVKCALCDDLRCSSITDKWSTDDRNDTWKEDLWKVRKI